MLDEGCSDSWTRNEYQPHGCRLAKWRYNYELRPPGCVSTCYFVETPTPTFLPATTGSPLPILGQPLPLLLTQSTRLIGNGLIDAKTALPGSK